jgi:hypothetical protein
MKKTKPKAKVVVRALKQPADLAAAQTRLRAKNEGKTTVTAPAPFLPPTDSAVEQHFTPAQVAQQWGVSTRTVRRLFANTPGVLKLGTKGKARLPSNPGPSPQSASHEVVRTSCLTRGQDHQVWRKIMTNILEQISDSATAGTSDPRMHQQLYSIKKIAGRNPVLA